MRIAVTGATGFLGRYIVNHLLEHGHACRCWHRPTSHQSGLTDDGRTIQWIPGRLNDPASTEALVHGVDAVVHSALDRHTGWNPSDTHLLDFTETNVLGSIRLMQAAQAAGVTHFVFISTCAVHDVILDDRPLDEAHPLWPVSHYGAHKAAIEKFVHSFGLPGSRRPDGWGVCALRPTGIYGLAQPVHTSKWFKLVGQVLAGERIDDAGGGKEVHGADVAKAVGLLLDTPPQRIAGQAYNCCDRYVAAQDVAQIAKDLTGSGSLIARRNTGPKNQIDTTKLRALGMTFGGQSLLEQTIAELAEAAGDTRSPGPSP